MLLKSVHLSVSRAVAMLLALVLVVGSAVAVAAPARAATGDSVTDGNVTATWLDTTFHTDGNNNGRPDAGDVVVVHYEISAALGSGLTEITLESLQVGGDHEPVGPQVVALPHTVNFSALVTADDLDPLGGGPHYSPVNFRYRIGSGATLRVPLSPPPLIYTPPTPVTVASFVELEGGGTLPSDGLVEGDRVRFAATVSNESAVAVSLGGAARLDSSPSLPTSLAAGDTTTLHGAWHTVTFADMRAGSVQFAATSVEWSVESLSGSAPVAAVSATTAVPVVSYTTHFDTVIHSPGYGVERAFGDAQVGDLLDRTYVATNTGNVVLNYFAMTNSHSGYFFYDVGLKPGESIPESGLSTSNDLAKGTSLPGGYFESDRHTLTAADIQRGYVDVSGRMGVSPSFDEQAWGSSGPVTTRVFLRELTADVSWTADAELQDTNGDGVGQSGEEVKLTWTAALPADADQSVTLGAVTESGQFGAVGAAFDGVQLAPGESSTHTDTVTIDAAWLASGALDYTATLSYSGDIDDAEGKAVAGADAVALGEYVAPPVSLAVVGSFDDLNGDGKASLGETVTFDVTVANDGTYPLTGVTLGEAGGATLDPAVLAVNAVLPGASAAWSATHVVTPADLAAGSVSYSPTVDADGMTTLTKTGSVSPLTFAAYESDLDGVAQGGVAICSAAGEHVGSAVQGDSVTVVLDACGGAALEDDSRIVAFSSPILLGVGAAPVTIPSALAAGDHRIAVYGADGGLVGWAPVAITAPVTAEVAPTVTAQAADPVADGAPVATGGELSTTGAEGIGPMLWLAAALMLAGAGGLVLARRRWSGVDA
ncbi:DUF7507 domain-containing protein [Demequina aurantiaca]|uniref:DUF7507 domain-containing protein n=1 Tax=Demequina aurantiaca TaxID=676200 RepID=UPI0007850982|nr:hypothetical protein [Demequina aurantiaca]